jgi:WD40 repeat protein
MQAPFLVKIARHDNPYREAPDPSSPSFLLPSPLVVGEESKPGRKTHTGRGGGVDWIIAATATREPASIVLTSEEKTLVHGRLRKTSSELPRWSSHALGCRALILAFAIGLGLELPLGDLAANRAVWAQEAVQPTTVLEGHQAEVYQLAFAPDGKRLASASFDKTVRIWSLATAKLETTIEAHDEKVLCLAFAAGGKELVTGSHDKSVRVWSLANGSRRLTLEGHDGPIYAVAAQSGAGETPGWIAGAGTTGVIHLWDDVKGASLRTLKGHEKSIYALAVQPGGKILASGSLDTTIRLWNSATGALEKTFAEHQDGVFCLAFSADGRYLFSGSSDHELRKWDVEDGTLAAVLKGHPHWVCGLALTPTTNTLVSADFAGNLISWDAENGKQRSHQQLSTVVYDVDLSPDGAWLATANRAGTLFLFARAAEKAGS